MQFSLKHVVFLSIVGAVKEKVFNWFYCDTLTQQASRQLSFAYAEEVLIKTDVAWAELK